MGRTEPSRGVPDKVAQYYYAHGLFCSSHPVPVLCFAIAVILLCCSPLVNLPLLGSAPQQLVVPPGTNLSGVGQPLPRWLGTPPACYVQQVIIRIAVSPWTSDLLLTDAFRGTLAEAFTLLEIVRNYQHDNSSRGLSQLCLHVEGSKLRPHLPEFGCLILSPVNLWQQDPGVFQGDAHLLRTIFGYQNLRRGKTSLTEMAFGMNMKDTGIKRYPVRPRQRILQYAVTLVLQDYDHEYITGLRHRLESHYSMNQPQEDVPPQEVMHVYYPGQCSIAELAPLSVTYLILFLYMYFSVRKIELVRSKVGMAFSAVATVLASLSMSVGLCFFFGLTLTMNGKEVFPYLVVIVGLENVLVLTKSVVSTPTHLDVKIRVAQGLSREGWSITKNLLTEVTILTAGLFTFVPAIQEFCIFAIVGLLSDFFLQMFFFSTVLAIDIRRMEVTEPHHPFRPYPARQFPAPNPGGLARSKSHPRLNGLTSNHPTNVVAPLTSPQILTKVPKRLRLVHFWARTRIFQRAFMVCMVVWISAIAYNSGVVEHFFRLTMEIENGSDIHMAADKLDLRPYHVSPRLMEPSISSSKTAREKVSTTSPAPRYVLKEPHTTTMLPGKVGEKTEGEEEVRSRLRHAGPDTWHRLSLHHWPTLLDLYNVSLDGRYVTLLPAIRLSHAVPPELVRGLRNPEEKARELQQWQTMAIALDPLELVDGEDASEDPVRVSVRGAPLVPNSPMELFLTAMLCLVSVVVLAYTTVGLYRCVCSRNYAEWRASWTRNEAAPDPQVVLEAVPLVLDGHPQEVECLASDGCLVASSCLGGQLRCWDSQSGELLACVDRRTYFSSAQEPEEQPLSDYESGSPPSRGELHNCLPDLRPAINTNFRRLEASLSPSSGRGGFDFESRFRGLYEEHRRLLEVDAEEDLLLDSWKQSKIGADENRTFSVVTPRHRKVHRASQDSVEMVFDIENCVGSSDANLSSIESPSQVEGTRLSSSVGSAEGWPPLCGQVPPIWSLDCCDGLVVLGCSTGRLEFWDGSTGLLKCIFEDGTGIGVTAIKLVGRRVVAAKLSGCVDFLELQGGRTGDWGGPHRRTHARTGSTGAAMDWSCARLHTARAHQQPITALDAEGGRVLTGSQDHTLKVLRLDDHSTQCTLHGHCGPVTCLLIDRAQPHTAGSGSQDGLLCVWDLLTSTCMYSVQAHDGSLTALSCSASYVISLGADERLCVWERFQGHLLNTIQVAHSYCSSMVMFTHSLLITSKQGSLVVWDVRTGEPVRVVRLGHSDGCTFVKQIVALQDSIACDYGNQLRIVRFPLVSDKCD